MPLDADEEWLEMCKCTSNSDCLLTKSCNLSLNRCIDPCALVKCDNGLVCIATNHLATCISMY